MDVRDLFLSAHLSNEEVSRFLKRYGFNDPEKADLLLQRLADAIADRERVVELADSLLETLSRTVDPDAALLHLEAFFESVPNALSLLSYLREHPSALTILSRLLGASPFLAQTLLRNPEYFYWLMGNERLQRVEGLEYFSKQASELTRPFHSLEASLEALRRWRRRESLRIAAQDLLETVSFEATVEQISQLAQAILQKVFELLSESVFSSPPRFAVLALGKLGGEELNFSSDVDLFYLHANDQEQEQMLKFAREYTRLLTEYTQQGRLYRVDLRLRPMGKSGDITYSLQACRQYYETWADTFDRLALLKCRWVAGDRELGARFLESVEDFVYKKYFDAAAVEEIRWLKRRTDRQLQEQRRNRNIKFGLGGIREIEFFVQAFQLLYAGEYPRLRHPSTLKSLDLLVDHGFIPHGDYTTLKDAYRFLRRLEHRLQLVYDLQTHSLPEGQEELQRCARRMGYRGKDGSAEAVLEQLLGELDQRGKEVHRIFASLFETDSRPADLQEIVLSPELSVEEAIEKLKSHAIPAPRDFYEGIALLKEARSYPHSPTRIRNLIANLIPRLVAPARMSKQPYRLFTRLDRFCEALGSRASLYSELIENPHFSHRLLSLFASGDFLSQILIRNPELLDSISELPSPEIDPLETDRFLKREIASGRDSLSALCLFKQREEFKIGLYDLFEPGTISTRSYLSDLAQVCLRWSARRVRQRMKARQLRNFTLLALGKLGGQELTYHSDLDVVLVYDETVSEASPEIYDEFLKLLCEALQHYTEFGPTYKLDLRLRPEGRHGPLAVPLQAFKEYFQTRAEAWERLAYVKMRPILVCGRALDLESVLWKNQPFSSKDLRELAHIRMRKEKEIGDEKGSEHYNFKVGRGGLMDIQFAVQYLQVQHGLRETNTGRALRELLHQGHLDQKRGDSLREGLEFLLALETMQRLLEETAASTISQKPEENRPLALFLGFDSGQALLDHYLTQRERIRCTYEEILR